jgi:hypothetical protein
MGTWSRMATLTLRAVFEAGTVLGLLDEPEFADNVALRAARDVKPSGDHYLAVFIFGAEPLDDGTRALRIISTTVLGIQRYITTRLLYQGVYPAHAEGDSLLMETLRAHYRAQQEDTMERFHSVGSALPLRWTRNFPNGAGDLVDLPEFIITDPDLEQLERLFSVPDPRSEAADDDEKI